MGETSIVKAAKQGELVRNLVERSSQQEMRVGSLYINNQGDYYRIDNMKPVKRVDWDLSKKKQEEAEGESMGYSSSVKKEYQVLVDDVQVREKEISSSSGAMTLRSQKGYVLALNAKRGRTHS